MKGLTPKQRDILTFIQEFIQKYRYSPSYREIMKQFAFSSPGSVYKHIRTLKRKGAITAEKVVAALYLSKKAFTNPHQGDTQLPFIGKIIAGHSIEMFKQTQTLAVPAFMVHASENTYILGIQGDALNEEAINDGDLILVEARQDAQAGETVLALINHQETVIKRYYPEGQYIRLEGCHPEHQSLTLRQDNLLIQGVVIGLIRSY